MAWPGQSTNASARCAWRRHGSQRTFRRTPSSTDTVELVSFDGGVTATCRRWRPDSGEAITSSGASGPRIARGGGYSYAAASFGGDSLVVDMTGLGRVLGFDAATRRIEVEAGTTLEDVLAVTGPHGLLLPVQPGYPRITVGGCIAPNVHGKNPFLEGTFRSHVESLRLFHPRHGTLDVSRDAYPELFELTCGGYGLTGVILSARLRLQDTPGFRMAIDRVDVGSLAAGFAAVRAMADAGGFAYTWHDGVPGRASFGRGFVYQGRIVPGAPYPARPRRYRRIDATTRRRLPVALLRGATSPLLTWGFRITERLKASTSALPLFEAMFPFARRSEYFLLFGRAGLAEAQVIVPETHAETFLHELERSLAHAGASSVMISMKLFRGEPGLLRFEGNGVCVTVDFARSAATDAFLPRFDELCVAAGALPNLIKDSRIPLATVRRCYPGYDEFRARLRAHDPERLFRSELSQRLAL